VLCGALALGSCGRDGVSREREALRDLNVILITVDTLRADHVSAYGDRARTPHIDRLADEGVVFERCISQTPLTLPAHVSLLSGTYPLHHRVRDNGGLAVPEELELVSETLRQHGFTTSAFVAAYVLHSKWGLDQGFDHYSDAFNRARYERILLQNEKRAGEVIGLAEDWIRAHESFRFFTWIHLFDPHTPYHPPAPFDELEDPYRGEVEYVDAALGGFFEFLRTEGLYDRSLVVLTGDHGESLGEHGEREHGLFVYEPTVRVPLVLRAPIGFPRKRVAVLVEHVDVVPTVLDLVGVPIPAAMQGESLADVMFGGEADGDATAYTETFYPRRHLGWAELRAFYQGGLKYVRAPRDELYELEDDPVEGENRAKADALGSRKEQLEDRLSAFVEAQSVGALRPAAARVGPEDVEALRALGYVTAPAVSSGGAPRADPKDKVGVFNLLADAAARSKEGDHEAAVAAARGVLADEPDLLEAHVLLGHGYQRQGMYQEAAESFERVLALAPDSNFAMIDLLSALINLGDYDRVIERAPGFLRTFPDDPILHEALGVAYFFEGDDDAALLSLERSLELGASAVALGRVGEIHARKGDLGAGESFLRRAVAMDPRQPGFHYSLGQIEETRGRPDEALALYRKELENDPGSYRAAFNAAAILKKQGKSDEAVDYYRKTLEANPDFNIPYFMIAERHLETGTALDEAIDLCKRGIDVAPEEKTALLGYQVLLQLLMKKGDRASYELYSSRARELFERVEATE
jgi:arylsulfatase A-like enzyme/Tfp pilus assembly protein PilF